MPETMPEITTTDVVSGMLIPPPRVSRQLRTGVTVLAAPDLVTVQIAPTRSAIGAAFPHCERLEIVTGCYQGHRWAAYANGAARQQGQPGNAAATYLACVLGGMPVSVFHGPVLFTGADGAADIVSLAADVVAAAADALDL